MNPHTPDSILDKIRALQALADRAGTEAEAALAAQRVAELCEKHNLDIGVATLAQEETAATEAMHVHESSRWAAHWSQLSHACGEMFNVGHYRKPAGIAVKDMAGRVIGSKDAQALVFFGLKANVASAQVTYEYYLASVEALLEGYIREGNRISGASEMRSFRLGCATRIGEEARKATRAAAAHRFELEQQQLRQIHEAEDAGMPMLAGEQRNALTVRNQEQGALVSLENKLIKAHRAKLHLRSGSAYSGAASRDHYSAGYAAGGRVDVHGARSSRMIGGN